MNIKVAVCDDMKCYTDKIREYADEYGKKRKYFVEITSFTDSLELCRYIESNHFDIYLLDIEMPGIGGIELGKKIKKRDEDAILIFITSHPQFAYDATQIEALGYLPKPPDENRFIRLMDRAVMIIRSLQEQIHQDNQYIEVTSESEKVKLLVKDIVVIEKCVNYIIITTKNGKEYKYYTTLKRIEEKLNRKRFLKISRNCYIHMAYIKDMKDQCVIVTIGNTEKCCSISRKAFRSVEMDVKFLLAKKRIR